MPELHNLEDLSIIQSPIKTIEGIHRFPSLKQLELAYLPKLETLSAIAELKNSLLELLECDHCKKVGDYEVIQYLKNLKILRFNDCGEIPTISFINDMPLLEKLSFVKTNILDGNLHPCLKLKYAGFFAKRHYSHTPEQIEAAIKQNLER